MQKPEFLRVDDEQVRPILRWNGKEILAEKKLILQHGLFRAKSM